MYPPQTKLSVLSFDISSQTRFARYCLYSSSILQYHFQNANSPRILSLYLSSYYPSPSPLSHPPRPQTHLANQSTNQPTTPVSQSLARSKPGRGRRIVGHPIWVSLLLKPQLSIVLLSVCSCSCSCSSWERRKTGWVGKKREASNLELVEKIWEICLIYRAGFMLCQCCKLTRVHTLLSE